MLKQGNPLHRMTAIEPHAHAGALELYRQLRVCQEGGVSSALSELWHVPPCLPHEPHGRPLRIWHSSSSSHQKLLQNTRRDKKPAMPTFASGHPQQEGVLRGVLSCTA